MDDRHARRLVGAMSQRRTSKRSHSGMAARIKTVDKTINSRLILIVDDDRELAKLFKRTFENDADTLTESSLSMVLP